MNGPTEKPFGILQWLRSLTKRRRALPEAPPAAVAATQLNLTPPPQEPVPGNYYLALTFDGVEYMATPKQAIRDIGKSPPTVVWGTRIDRCMPRDDKDKVRWTDDPTNGLARRPRRSPEDWLGAEGAVGDMKLVFERILQTTKNQVTYSLLNPQRGIRIAYAFPLQLFASKPS